MKNMKKILGIIALAVIIGLSMAACSNDSGGGGGNAALGYTLNLTGQVYTEHWDDDNFRLNYTEFTGSIPSFNTGIGGTGGITNGQLNFTIGTPTSFEYPTDDQWWDENATVNPASAKGAMLWLEANYGYFLKRNHTISGNENRGSETIVVLAYVYVDRDATISAPRWNDSGTEYGYSWSETFNAYTLNLKEGWNVINFKEAYSWTENSDTETITVSAGEPGGLRWFYNDWDIIGYSMGITPNASKSSRIYTTRMFYAIKNLTRH